MVPRERLQIAVISVFVGLSAVAWHSHYPPGMRTLKERRRLAGITLVELALLMALGVGVAMAISREPLLSISADVKLESSRSSASAR